MTTTDSSTLSIDSVLLGDAPLSDPRQDLFGRAKFSERVAYVLAERRDPNSLVVGIYGKWGSGKTTVLNFIGRSLDEQHKDKVVAINFNPWRFTGEDKLLLSFFDSFERELGRLSPVRRSEIVQDVAKYVRPLVSIAGVFGSVFLKTGTPGMPEVNASDVATLAEKTVDQVAAALADVDIEKLKKKIEGHIEQSGKRLVVLIDDLDRLDKAEIQAVFRLIKLAADFKHVTYVLAFDPDVVADSLVERYGKRNEKAGYEFLEKIVQVPLNLPRAKSKTLLDICLSGIQEAARLAGVDFPRQDHEIVWLFENGFSARLTTPRLAKRFSNSIVFTMPILAGELNAIDFILMEGIRVFYPDTYAHIRDNSKYYLLNDTLANIGQKPEEYRAFRGKALETLDPQERASVEQLVEYLFPRTIGSRMHVMWDQYPEEYRNQRVASPAYFERYFAYSIPDGDISDQIIDAFVRSISQFTQAETCEKLTEMLRMGGAGNVLSKLGYKVQGLDSEENIALARALISLGDAYPFSQWSWISSVASPHALGVAEDLLRRIPWDERRIAIQEIVSSSEPLHFVASFLLYARGRHKEPTLVDSSFQEEMFSVIAERIEELVHEASMFGPDLLPYARNLLSCWREGKSRTGVHAYLAGQFREDPERVIAFLSLFPPNGVVGEQADVRKPQIGDFGREHYDKVTSLVDANIVEQILRSEFGDELYVGDNIPSYLDNVPFELRIAQQFTTIHRASMQETTLTTQSPIDSGTGDLLNDVE